MRRSVESRSENSAATECADGRSHRNEISDRPRLFDVGVHEGKVAEKRSGEAQDSERLLRIVAQIGVSIVQPTDICGDAALGDFLKRIGGCAKIEAKGRKENVGRPNPGGPAERC